MTGTLISGFGTNSSSGYSITSTNVGNIFINPGYVVGSYY
jgi:hypothetical protein